MKAFLMYKDRDVDLQQTLPSNEPALTQDLEITTLLNAMALGDPFLLKVARNALFSGLNTDLDTILYRQHILQDCLNNAPIVRSIYAIAVESMESKKKQYYSIFSNYPSSILSSSIGMLQMFVDLLKKLKTIADDHADAFQSEGFTAFFGMLRKELDDAYFESIQTHLRTLKFRGGVLMSAGLGQGNEGTDYILRKPQERDQGWRAWVFAQKSPVYTFSISDRDEHGARALSELRDRGLNLVANALAQSTDHILSFFTMLQTELAFYMGCLNLHGQLTQKGEPLTFPLPVASDERRHTFQGLCDVCLALLMEQKIVGNTVQADNTDLVIITGANQGGKSTFLRSIGLAQLMMQCGMFVAAEFFCANICNGLFTHYKREEDATLNSGKLDEELSRMSEIVDALTPNALVLFNESFAATNEREGSEIARQIMCALVEKRIKVFFVTHLYAFAHRFYDQQLENVMFLLAERRNDGGRTFKLVEGEPLQTSYGEDLYTQIFAR
jgi:DNA mismatch repair ATPase MutS